jgi:hypothetical protein
LGLQWHDGGAVSQREEQELGLDAPRRDGEDWWGIKIGSEMKRQQRTSAHLLGGWHWKLGWDLAPAFAEFEFCSNSTLIQLVTLILFVNQIYVCVLTEITEIDNTRPIILLFFFGRAGHITSLSHTFQRIFSPDTAQYCIRRPDDIPAPRGTLRERRKECGNASRVAGRRVIDMEVLTRRLPLIKRR